MVYDEVNTPVPHYIVHSELYGADLDGVNDCALFVIGNDLVKVIIPNDSTVDADDYFFGKYPDLSFSKAFCCKGDLIGTIFTEKK